MKLSAAAPSLLAAIVLPYLVVSVNGLGFSELASEVSFPGGVCPVLPANRAPVFSTPPLANDGWVIVNFCGTGCENHYNDDGSASQDLSFAFDMFGSSFSKTYINTNGNISFRKGLTSFSAEGFPLVGSNGDVSLVAPFWADVDIGNDVDSDLGHIWMKAISLNVLAVAWDYVGYYNKSGDKRNTFMVMISDGLDPSMGVGNNVCFCYEDMEWTTGDVSGTSGFGGYPATAGVNKGTENLYMVFGQYNGKCYKSHVNSIIQVY